MRSFLFGLGVGVGVVLAPTIGLAVLFTSLSDDSRKAFSEKAGELAASAKQKFEEGKQRMQNAVAVCGAAIEQMGNASED